MKLKKATAIKLIDEIVDKINQSILTSKDDYISLSPMLYNILLEDLINSDLQSTVDDAGN